MDNVIIKEFREKLDYGVLGVFSKTGDPGMIEVMGFAGLDFVIIDMEHGPNNILSAQNLIRAAQLSGIFPIVRVKENVPSLIGEVLDVGAGGVQVPCVTTKREAEAIMERAKFSPDGIRGVCRFVRAADYSSKDRFRYFEEANQSVIIVQIEGKEGIDNIDDILDVPGIDVVFIGPYDLSQSLGIPGQIEHPAVEEKMIEIIKKCAGRNVLTGIFADTPENAEKWKRAGVKYIAYSVDVGIFYQAVSQVVHEIGAKEGGAC